MNARVRGAGGRASPFYASTARLTYIEGREGRKEGPVPGEWPRVQSFALASSEGGREGGSHNNETALVCAHTYLVHVPSRIAALWVCMRRLSGRLSARAAPWPRG